MGCGECDPLGGVCIDSQCYCREGYMGFSCGLWTRDVVNEPFFLAYRWATFAAFAVLAIWTIQAIRIRREDNSRCRLCSSTPTLCLALLVMAAGCRCVEFAVDPHMWAGVLPWNMRAASNLALMLMVASYCAEIIVWITLVQQFASHNAGMYFCCLKHQSKVLTGSVVVLTSISTASLLLHSSGLITDYEGTLSYFVSLIVVMILTFGYTVVFGGRVVCMLKVAKSSPQAKVLTRLTRFIFVACTQNVCAVLVLVVNTYLDSCQNILVPFAQCYVAWYGGFRFLELAGCVLVVLAVRRTYSDERELFTDTGWTTEQLSSQEAAEVSSNGSSSFPSFPLPVPSSLISSPLITPFVSPRHTASFFSLDELLMRNGELLENEDNSQSTRLLNPVND